MDADYLPRLPLLPPVRPRRLTLTLSSPTEESDTARSHYGLFGRLPLEIRQQILTEAFGNRMLHAGLSRKYPADHPERPDSWPERQQARRWKYLAEGVMSWVAGKGWKKPHKPHKPHENACCARFPDCGTSIQWTSSVCHRERFLEGGRWAINFMTTWKIFSAMRTPDMDYCNGHWDDEDPNCYCRGWPAEQRAVECRVSITGWLLSCRQAYVYPSRFHSIDDSPWNSLYIIRYSDTIDILYATNGFHFFGRPLIPNLPRLILPERLANIQKLELIWHISPSGYDDQGPFDPTKFDNKNLRWLCDALPNMFPQLNELHLSLSGFLKGPGFRKATRHETVLAAERFFLSEVEAMLPRLPRLYERVYNVHQQGSDEGNALHVLFDCSHFWQAMLWTHDSLGTPGLRAVTDETTIAGKYWKQAGENGGYWVCTTGLVWMEHRHTEKDLVKWGFTADDLAYIDQNMWRGLRCLHELWYDDSSPAKHTGA